MKVRELIAGGAVALAVTCVADPIAIQRVNGSYWWMRDEQVVTSDEDAQFDPSSAVVTESIPEAVFTARPKAGCKVAGWGYVMQPPATPLDFTMLTATGSTCTWKKNDEAGSLVLLGLCLDWISYSLAYNDDEAVTYLYTNEVKIASYDHERTGYTFSGSWTNAAGKAFAAGEVKTGADLVGTSVHEDGARVNLWPKWNAHVCSLAYELGGGVAGGSYPSGATYDVAFTLADPVRTGYGLKEWAVEPKPEEGSGAQVVRMAGGWQFKNLSAVDGITLKLTAVWTNCRYKVTFNNHGASAGRTEPMYVEFDKAYDAVNIPQKKGSTFTGYFMADKGGEMLWDDAGQPVNATWKWVSDVTAHAQWKAEEFDIEYDSNGGDGWIDAQHVTNGVMTVLSDGIGFSRPGCTFMGWSKVPTGKVQYAPGAKVTFDEKIEKLYAVWEIPYYISYDGHRATSGEMKVQRCLRNEEAYLTLNNYLRDGYAFMGWALSEEDADKLSVKYKDGEAVFNLSDVPGATNALFAVWSTNAYWVAFDPGRGLGEPMEPMKFVYDEAQALSKSTYKAPSDLHQFVGWENPLNGEIIADGAVVSNLCAVADGTNTLKAIWSLDVGDLSKAMHCTTLIWDTNTVNSGIGWTIMEDGTGVSQVGGGSTSGEYTHKDWLTATVMTNGTLSFCYRFVNRSAGKAVVGFSTSEGSLHDYKYGDQTEVSQETNEWNSIEIPVKLAEGDSKLAVNLVFDSKDTAESIVIDRMVWIPEGGSVVPPEDPRVPVAIPQAVSGLTYDGKEKTGVLAGEGYWITGNKATRPGDYEAVATPLYGYRWDNDKSDDTNAAHIAWSIGKAVKDVSGVTFKDMTFVYDGTEHKIAVEKVPDGVTVTYEGGASRTAAGTNEVKACFSFTDPSDAELYELRPESLSAKLIVTRARKNVDYVTFDDVIAVYDGTSHTISVTNDLPEGVEVVYTPNDATNRVDAGTNEVTVTFKLADPDNYEPIDKELKARLIVLKADKDVSGVTFPDAEFLYDGQPHSFGVVGEIPDGVEVVYDGATNRTEAGTNVVTASFLVTDAKNWNEITNTLTAALVIIPLSPGLFDNELHPGGAIGDFTAQYAVTYNGWLRELVTSNIVGTITVKTSAAKSGQPCKVTIYVTPIGAKKKTFKTSFVPGEGRITDEYGIIYGATGLAGTFCDGVVIREPLVVEAAKDFSKSKIDAEKALTGDYPVGCYTVALGTGEGQTSGFDCLSVTVAKKTGKAKVAGTLDDGTKFSLSCQGVLGRSFAVPVVLSGKKNAAKEPVSFGLVVWIEPSSRTVSVSGQQGDRWPGGLYLAKELVQPADRGYRFGFDLPAYRDYLTAVDGFAVAPTDTVYQVTGKKWDAGKTVGSVKVDKATGEPYVKYKPETQVPANLPKLKFSYTPKTGVVKGSFKLYYRLDGKLKTDSATITGIAVDAVLRGNAVIKVNKKKEHFPLWSEIPVSP